MTRPVRRCASAARVEATPGIARSPSRARSPLRWVTAVHGPCPRAPHPACRSVSDSADTAPVAAPRLWAVVGATGTGKSELALNIAEGLRSRGNPAEIINVDAMQLYRGMDIGTAKLPLDERRGIPHHLFDVREVDEEAAVAWYQPEARAAVLDVQSRGGDAILVGGSGLYVSSVVFDFRFPPVTSPSACASKRNSPNTERTPCSLG